MQIPELRNSYQVFQIGTDATATLAGLTIAQGSVGPDGGLFGEGDGGGIQNEGTLTLTSCTLSNNMSATESGGGISNDGALTVIRCTFSGNSAYYGGAIANTGTLSVADSTFSGNLATEEGGAIESGEAATICASTFSANGSYFGGAISSAHTLTVTGCTLSGNIGHDGGGIEVDTAFGVTSTVLLDDTIVANSTNGDLYDHGTGTAFSGSYDLIDDNTGRGLFQNSFVGAAFNPELAPLDYYGGGPTETFALYPGSPALGTGDPALAGRLDQNGVVRPDGQVDIGAFNGVTEFVVQNTNDSGPGSLRAAITHAEMTGYGGTVIFQAGVSGAVPLKSALPTLTGHLDIDGPAASQVTVDGSAQFQVFDIASGATVEISNLTIADGYSADNGGGIEDVGTLTRRDSTVSGNRNYPAPSWRA